MDVAKVRRLSNAFAQLIEGEEFGDALPAFSFAIYSMLRQIDDTNVQKEMLTTLLGSIVRSLVRGTHATETRQEPGNDLH